MQGLGWGSDKISTFFLVYKTYTHTQLHHHGKYIFGTS